MAGLFVLLACGQALGQGLDNPFTGVPSLNVTHACLDPTNGDLLVISNSWRVTKPNLRRFHPDGTSDLSFILERFESCCAIHPFLLATDKDGNIYTLETPERFGGYYIYKHNAAGELHIDWGEREGETPVLSPLPEGSDYSGGALDDSEEEEEESGGGWEAGESSLLWNAGGGRLEFDFRAPVNLIPRSDGSLLVLDIGHRYVYLVDPEGRTVTEFIGRQGYIPIRPQRLLQDAQGYLYLVDYFDEFDLNRQGTLGVFRFTPDGEYQFGWGEGANGINDPWRPGLDLASLVINGSGVMIALGGETTEANHETVYVFDLATGIQIGRDRVQYRLGMDDNYIATLGGLVSGFVVLERRDFDILVNYYTRDGIRERQVCIADLYIAE